MISSPHVHRLNGPFAVQVEYLQDGTVFASHRRLPIHGYGRTVATALLEFAGMFDALWRSLHDVPPEKLTHRAQRFREQLDSMVAKIDEQMGGTWTAYGDPPVERIAWLWVRACAHENADP